MIGDIKAKRVSWIVGSPRTLLCPVSVKIQFVAVPRARREEVTSAREVVSVKLRTVNTEDQPA